MASETFTPRVDQPLGQSMQVADHQGCQLVAGQPDGDSDEAMRRLSCAGAQRGAPVRPPARSQMPPGQQEQGNLAENSSHQIAR